MSRELREESSALQALGLLAGDDLVRFRGECRADPALREMSRVLCEVTSQLVHWAPSYSPPEALRERVLQRIGSRRTATDGPERDRTSLGPAG